MNEIVKEIRMDREEERTKDRVLGTWHYFVVGRTGKGDQRRAYCVPCTGPALLCVLTHFILTITL